MRNGYLPGMLSKIRKRPSPRPFNARREHRDAVGVTYVLEKYGGWRIDPANSTLTPIA